MPIIGAAVTEETLKSDLKFADTKIDQTSIAQYAEDILHACEGKVDNYLEEEKNKDGRNASTRVKIYNSTGKTMFYQFTQEYYGRMASQPYDLEIKNGEWSGFLHTKFLSHIPAGSSAIVVYRIGNEQDEDKTEVAMGWSTAWWPTANSVYLAMDDSFKNDDTVYKKAETKEEYVNNEGGHRKVSYSNYEAEAIISNAQNSVSFFHIKKKTPPKIMQGNIKNNSVNNKETDNNNDTSKKEQSISTYRKQ